MNIMLLGKQDTMFDLQRSDGHMPFALLGFLQNHLLLFLSVAKQAQKQSNL